MDQQELTHRIKGLKFRLCRMAHLYLGREADAPEAAEETAYQAL